MNPTLSDLSERWFDALKGNRSCTLKDKCEKIFEKRSNFGSVYFSILLGERAGGTGNTPNQGERLDKSVGLLPCTRSNVNLIYNYM